MAHMGDIEQLHRGAEKVLRGTALVDHSNADSAMLCETGCQTVAIRISLSGRTHPLGIY